MSITKTRREHPAWKEWARVWSRNTIAEWPIVERWQYIFKSKKGKVSVVELRDFKMAMGWTGGSTFWEIYCLEGDLFDDVERFGTLDEAEAAARKYLN